MKTIRRLLLIFVLALGAGACSSPLGPDYGVDSGGYAVDSGGYAVDGGG